MPRHLTSNAVSAYRRDGFLCPLDVMSPVESRKYRKALEEDEATHGNQFHDVYRHSPHLLTDWAWELVHNERLLDAVEDLLGPNLLCWDTTVFPKPANSTQYISWHQDITYWGLDSGEVCTAWLALSPSTTESGCMRVIPGTHLQDVVPHKDTFSEQNMLSRGQELAVDVNEDHAINLELQPGQASIHHAKTFHGSNPNQSNDRRIGFAIRYMTPGVKQVAGASDYATLVRGTDAHSNFKLVDRPHSNYPPEAIRSHAWILEERRKFLMR